MADDNDNKGGNSNENKGNAQRPQQPSQQAVANAFAAVGEVTIEIETRDRKTGRPTGGNVNWPVPSMMLRGAWPREMMIGVSGMVPLQQMPSIPGLRIRFDGRTRTVTVYDPLTLPEYANDLATIHRNYDLLFSPPVTAGPRPHHAGRPEETQTHANLEPTDLKTWLWWMRQHVSDCKAKVLAGTLPELAEISRLPGKTLVETFNSPETTRYLEDRKRGREPAYA